MRKKDFDNQEQNIVKSISKRRYSILIRRPQYIIKSLKLDFNPKIKIRNRQTEEKYIQSFITNAIEEKKSSAILCIGGILNKEKEICVKNVIDKIKGQQVYQPQNAKFLFVNAMKIRKPQGIFKQIISHLHHKLLIDSIEASKMLKEYFQKGMINRIRYPPQNDKQFSIHIKHRILIINSAELLLSDDLGIQIIQKLDQWRSYQKSHLTVILIDNKDQLLKRVVSTQLQHKIEHINFDYKQRLSSYKGIFSKKALQFIDQQMQKKERKLSQWFNILSISVKKYARQHYSPKHLYSSIYVKNIPFQLVEQAINQYDNSFKTFKSNSFLETFKEFPSSYKLILAYLCKFYQNQTQNETQNLTLHNLFRIVDACPIHTLKQLRHILYDLKDLGIIWINYYWLPNSRRKRFDLRVLNGFQQETIQLLIDYKKIIKAIDLDSTFVKIQQPIDEQKVEQINFEAAIKLQGESIQQEQEYQCQQLPQIQSKLIKNQQSI